MEGGSPLWALGVHLLGAFRVCSGVLTGIWQVGARFVDLLESLGGRNHGPGGEYVTRYVEG